MFKTRFTCRNEVKMHYRIDQKTRRLDDQQPATSRPTDQKTRRPEDQKTNYIQKKRLSFQTVFLIQFILSFIF